MCWWIFGHCWHRIDGTLRKVPYKDKCAKHDGFRRTGHYGTYIVLRGIEECCVCKKRREYTVEDYDLMRAEAYKVYGEDQSEDWKHGVNWMGMT